jgi:nucleoside-diphosphate-sugar epimerase
MKTIQKTVKARDYAGNTGLKPPIKSVFIVGCGDLGRRVAERYQPSGQQDSTTVFGLARSQESAQRLEAVGIHPIGGDLERTETLCELPTDAGVVFYFAPPPGEGVTDPLVRNFLSSVFNVRNTDTLPDKLILISTTAVYGDCKGAWITETQPTDPQTTRGRRRLDAETAVCDWSVQTGVPVIILRVSGIYGPGRLPIARIEKRLPVLREAESPFTNRIHQDDLAQICIAAAERGQPGEVYNIADGRPSTMSHYFKAVAEACGLPPPPEITHAEAAAVMSAGMLSYLNESRRLDTSKMRDELRIELRYPSLVHGLEAWKRSCAQNTQRAL